MDKKSIVIKLFTGPYNNSDAINSVLGYISTDNHKPVPIGGYGFFPITVDTAIKAFQFVDDSMQKFYPDNQKVWHLTISCDSSFNYTEVLYIAERFSSKLYDYGYYTFYGIHHPDSKDKSPKRSYHIHIGIQYFSYNMYVFPLDWHSLKKRLEEFAFNLEYDHRQKLISMYKTTDLSSFPLIKVSRCF